MLSVFNRSFYIIWHQKAVYLVILKAEKKKIKFFTCNFSSHSFAYSQAVKYHQQNCVDFFVWFFLSVLMQICK